MRTKKLLAIVTVLTMIATMLSGLTVSADIVNLTVQYDGTDGLFSSTTADGFTFNLDSGTFTTSYTNQYNNAVIAEKQNNLMLLTTDMGGPASGSFTADDIGCAEDSEHVHPYYTITAPAGAVITSYSVEIIGAYDGGSVTCGTETWTAISNAQHKVPNLYQWDAEAGAYATVKTEAVTPAARPMNGNGSKDEATEHVASDVYGMIHRDCVASGVTPNGEARATRVTWNGLNTTSIKLTLPSPGTRYTKGNSYGFQTISYDIEVIPAVASLVNKCLPAGGNKLAIEFNKQMNAIDADDVAVASSNGEAVDVLSVEMYDNDTKALVTLDTVFAAEEVYSVKLPDGIRTKDDSVLVDTFFMLQIAPEVESAALIYEQPISAAGANAATNPFIVESNGVAYNAGQASNPFYAANLNPGTSLEGSLVYTFPGEVLELAFTSFYHGDGLTDVSENKYFKCQVSADGDTWTDVTLAEKWCDPATGENPTRSFEGTYISMTANRPDYTDTDFGNFKLASCTLGEAEAGSKYVKIIYPVGVSGINANNRQLFNLKVAYTAPTVAEEVTTKIESNSEAAYAVDDTTVQYSANVTKNGMGAVIVAVAYDINGNVLGMKVGSQLSTGANTVKLDIKVDDAYSATSVKAFYFESLGDIEPLRIPVEIATE